MPDKRTHRGPHPEDAQLFAAEKIGALRAAVADVGLLLTKGYALKSSLKLVGDRFALTERQRIAVMRCACSDEQLANRTSKQTAIADLAHQAIVIDGYNTLITIEAYLSAACIFIGRDRCFRDLAGIHGTYRKVTETTAAIELVAEWLRNVQVENVLWLFDSPVSNSGRLKTLIRQLVEENDWPWRVELETNPDTRLIETDMIIATSDSNVLDKCGKWTNLCGEIIGNDKSFGNIIDLSEP